MIATKDLYWAAGFLEGEGSFLCTSNAKCTALRVVAAQVQREPLERLLAIFGGAITDKPVQNENWQPCLWWNIYRGAAGVMMTLYPLMSPRRKEQIRKALTTWRSVRSHYRYRTHCPQGHPYDAANTARRQNGSGVIARRCMACTRTRGSAFKARYWKQKRWAKCLPEIAAWAS